MTHLLRNPILTFRVHAGLNAASILAGLLSVTGATKFGTAQDLLQARFPETDCQLQLLATQVRGIAGVTSQWTTPHEHAHRTIADIDDIYEHSALSAAARQMCRAIWLRLGTAEARVHGTEIDQVHFHEVGRMSNILSVGLIAELFVALNPSRFIVSALPMGDGLVHCAHGAVPYPAPATLAMLDGVPVRPTASSQETVSPTGLGIVLGLGAEFGPWPQMRVRAHTTAFAPGRIYSECANGVIVALGEA